MYLSRIPCDNIDSKAELAGSSSGSSMCPSSEDPVYEIPLHEKVDKTGNCHIVLMY